MVTFGSRQTKLLVRGRSAEAQQPQGAITGKKGMFLRGGQHSQSEADALNSEPTCAVGRSLLEGAGATRVLFCKDRRDKL